MAIAVMPQQWCTHDMDQSPQFGVLCKMCATQFMQHLDVSIAAAAMLASLSASATTRRFCVAQDTKAVKETKLLQDFYDMMAHDSARAFYGPGHVQAAHELGAVQTLLITDTLFRVNNVLQVCLACAPCNT